MPRTTSPDVVVVGAGAAGLAAAAALRRNAIDAVVLEALERIGGVWAGRYERLHLHTVRRFSGLPYHPLPRRLPRYVSKDAYGDYLADYASALELDVRVNEPVEEIRPSGARWMVRTAADEWNAEAVVVATGRHNRPRIPQWPGLEGFSGRIVHSGEYRSAEHFRGQAVLVVGLGNSGAEIATDLVEQGAERVAIAVRTAPPIVHRELAGVPVQVLGMVLMPFPPRPVDRLGAAFRRVGVGDLTRYGLAKAEWGPFEARRPPVIDVGFLATLKRGAVTVRPAVERLTGPGVVFADGSEEPFDAIVAATGFSTALEELFDLAGVIDARGLPKVGPGGASAHAGLYFIGFRESARGALFEANRDARRLARGVARYLAEQRSA